MDSASENPLNGRLPRMAVLNSGNRNLNEGSSIQFAQNFLNEIVDSTSKEGIAESKLCLQLENNNSEKKGEPIDGEPSEGADLSGYSKIREDGFMLFKNLCKLPLKFSSQEHADDNILLREKVLPLERLKVIMDNAGPIWRSP
ncbi:hypothetical protein CQW23_13862 [Capsicum baccatum]|uniref:Uncharacterized protein n=1 Tax=Capsicum baccatum TaxID=33114 RepID=A0A2G2WHJ6_CAPBA|nr:hypothetical protein CQW23_13862 [Capsicum baccatum]